MTNQKSMSNQNNDNKIKKCLTSKYDKRSTICPTKLNQCTSTHHMSSVA